jgi:hypothetical protein
MSNPLRGVRGGSHSNMTIYGLPTTYREAAAFSDRNDVLYSFRFVYRVPKVKAGDPFEPPPHLRCPEYHSTGRTLVPDSVVCSGELVMSFVTHRGKGSRGEM